MYHTPYWSTSVDKSKWFLPREIYLAQILILHHVIEEVKEHNLSAVFTFVDFNKAFDSINWDIMFNVLLAYGIPSQILKGIGGLFLDTMAQVVTKDGNTNFFPIIAGVQQGDTLASYLFIIVLDYIVRIAMAKDDNFGITLHWQRGRCCQAVCLTDADFADEITLLSDTQYTFYKYYTIRVTKISLIFN